MTFLRSILSLIYRQHWCCKSSTYETKSQVNKNACQEYTYEIISIRLFNDLKNTVPENNLLPQEESEHCRD